jgi:BirA family biotin operon repressor/biotin-[acetyl-CoA-carboxylase] ligase
MRILPWLNPFGAPVYHEETVPSTMDLSRLLARRGEAHGTVAVADFQEAGRGRQGRPWRMNRGENLSFTILLRYPGFAALPRALSLKTGLAVSRGIGDFAPSLAGRLEVKWPNDVMIREEGGPGALKAAGILIEAEGPLVHAGIGVNLAQRDFPEELRGRAGSILGALGKEAPPFPPEARQRLLEGILLRLREELEGPGAASWRPRLEARLFRRGERVLFLEGPAASGRPLEGTLAGIGEGGELLLIPGGETAPRPFLTGELRVYGPGAPFSR